MQAGEIDDEPEPVRPGLGRLSVSLDSLAAELLRIDDDLLDVAAEASALVSDLGLDRDEFLSWVGALASAEKDEWITRVRWSSTCSAWI